MDDQKVLTCTFDLETTIEDHVENPESGNISSERKAKKQRAKPEERKTEKKQKKTQLIGDEAEEVVFRYMKMQNRPYSSQNIFDNLHGVIAKPNLQRTLDSSILNGKLISKEYGKFKVYMVNQNVFGDALTEEEHRTLDLDVSSLKEEINPLESQVKEFRQEISKAQGISERTSKFMQLQEDIRSAESELAERRQHQALVSGSTVDPMAAQGEHRKLHLEWHQRKKVCESLLSTLSQSLELQQSDLIEELGIDTDEDCVPTDAYSMY